MVKDNLLIEITEDETILSTSAGTYRSFNIGWKDIDQEIAWGMDMPVEKVRKIREGEITLGDPRKVHLFNEIFQYRCFDLFKLLTSYGFVD